MARRQDQPDLERKGSGDSQFAEATPDGHDVFFSTVHRLSPSDIDNNTDIYDARIDGGFSASTASTQCSGEECRPRRDPASGAEIGSELASGTKGGQKPASPQVKARKYEPRSGTIKLVVQAKGPGMIEVTGSGVKPLKQKTRAGTGGYTLRVKLTSQEQKKLSKVKKRILS